MPLDGIVPRGPGAGRPRRDGKEPVFFRGEFVEKAYNLALLGASDAIMAGYFGVDPIALIAWRRRYPAFDQAIVDGGVNADAEMARSFFHRGRGYEYDSEKIFYDGQRGEVVRAPTRVHVPGDPGAARQWLAGRQPELWAQRAQVDVNLSVTDARERFLNLIEGVAQRAIEGTSEG
jgi:hypothetical protein